MKQTLLDEHLHVTDAAISESRERVVRTRALVPATEAIARGSRRQVVRS